MYRKWLSAESLLIIELAMCLCAALVQSTLHDDAVNELNNMILKEIELKREALDMLRKDSGRSKNGLSMSGTASLYPSSKRSRIPLSLTDGIKKSLIRTGRKKITNNNDNNNEVIEKNDVLLKRMIREEILKTNKIDAIVNTVYNKLKRQHIADALNTEDIYHILDNIPYSADPPKGPSKDAESKYAAGPPGLWGKDEMGGPPGLWGKDEERGPPGLWGKREEIAREYMALNRALNNGPPGLWGREVPTRHQSTANDLPLLMGAKRKQKNMGKRSSSEYRQPTLWSEVDDNKTSNRRRRDIPA